MKVGLYGRRSRGLLLKVAIGRGEKREGRKGRRKGEKQLL